MLARGPGLNKGFLVQHPRLPRTPRTPPVAQCRSMTEFYGLAAKDIEGACDLPICSPVPARAPATQPSVASSCLLQCLTGQKGERIGIRQVGRVVGACAMSLRAVCVLSLWPQMSRLDFFRICVRKQHGCRRPTNVPVFAGAEVNFDSFKGKVVLITNVASACGYTNSNYKELTALHEKYHSSGLEIMAFPCNQFGKQEKGAFQWPCHRPRDQGKGHLECRWRRFVIICCQ